MERVLHPLPFLGAPWSQWLTCTVFAFPVGIHVVACLSSSLYTASTHDLVPVTWFLSVRQANNIEPFPWGSRSGVCAWVYGPSSGSGGNHHRWQLVRSNADIVAQMHTNLVEEKILFLGMLALESIVAANLFLKFVRAYLHGKYVCFEGSSRKGNEQVLSYSSTSTFGKYVLFDGYSRFFKSALLQNKLKTQTCLKTFLNL